MQARCCYPRGKYVGLEGLGSAHNLVRVCIMSLGEGGMVTQAVVYVEVGD